MKKRHSRSISSLLHHLRQMKLLLLITSCISTIVFPCLVINISSAVAATPPSTNISPTVGTGSPASLGTIITSETSTVPTSLCTANCVITGGTRAGNNLFHSFGDFNIGALDSARFQTGLLNPHPDASVSNILARVTGGPSNLFGNLDSATYYPSANLFLMNPAGFLFGPNATVNVGGMMSFTTADYLKLGDNLRFNAIPNSSADALLSAEPVAAFGFLGSNPKAITFEGGQLTVASGTDIALVGGDISLMPDSSGTPSSITAPGRPIQLTSVSGPGEVAADMGIPAPEMILGTITLGQSTILSTAGDPLLGDGSGGAVSIRGGNLVATGAKIITIPFTDDVNFSSTGSGGDITVNVRGSADIANTTLQTSSRIAGAAGAISITAIEGLKITNSTMDSTSTEQSFGDSGAVTLFTEGSLSVTNLTIRTTSDTSGNAGAVILTGKDVTLDKTHIIAQVFGDPSLDLGMVHSGAVTVSADNTVTISGSSILDPTPLISTTASATLVDASPVLINGKTVTLTNGTIDATMHNLGIVSPGNAGAIEIQGNNVNLTQFQLLSRGDGPTESNTAGGSIRILDANNIQLTGSQISASASSGGGGGAIEFQTKTLTLSNHTDVATSSFGQGAGGTITLKGTDNVTIESGSRVLTDVVIGQAGAPQGTAGNILVETQDLAIRTGGQIGARALPNSTGNAGNITVQGNSPAQSILIDGAGSGIFSTTEGTGAGGNITLFANTVTVQNGGTVASSTSGNAVTAKGGNVTITAGQSVNLLNHASVTASSTGQGNAGKITIHAGNTFEARNSSVTTKSEKAGSEDIEIKALDRIRLVNSQVNASAFLDGGNITIDPNVVVLQNSQILAQAIRGTGGNITITTPLFLADSTSFVSASSQFGLNGTVTIQRPTSNLSESLGPLTSKPSQTQSLLTQRCAALVNGQASSFVVAGREQLPADPGGWLSSPLAFATLGENLATGDAVASAPVIMAIAARDTGTVSLRRLTPAGFLIANFADSEATGCHS